MRRASIWRRLFGLQEIQHKFMRSFLHVLNEAVLEFLGLSKLHFLMKALLIIHANNLGEI